MHSLSNSVITGAVTPSSHTRPSTCEGDLTRYIKRRKKLSAFLLPFIGEESFPIQAGLKYYIEPVTQ